MTAPTRMGVLPIFVYRDLHRGMSLRNRIPFPEAGFDVAKAPGAVAFDQTFVYDAELYYVPPGGSPKDPLVLHVRKGFAHVSREDDFFLKEGEEHRFFLDAWNGSHASFHLDGSTWRHPGPPPAEHFTRVRLGSGMAAAGAHPLLDLQCTRFAWWRRLELLVETLTAMAAPYQAFCRDAMAVVGLTNATHAFLSAMGASAPTRYTEPAFVRALEASQRAAERILAVMDGRLSSKNVTFLQQYSNVCALVWDLFNVPEFQRSLTAYGGLVPDEQRSIIVAAVQLMAMVPPGYEIARVTERGARIPEVTKTREAPNYATRFLRRFYFPWLTEAMAKLGKPMPEELVAPAPSEMLVDSAKSWKGVLKTARRGAFAFVGLAKGLMKETTDLGAHLRVAPATYAAVEGILHAAGDEQGASWASMSRLALEKMEASAAAALEKSELLSAAGRTPSAAGAAPARSAAEAAARRAAMLEAEAFDLAEDVVMDVLAWAKEHEVIAGARSEYLSAWMTRAATPEELRKLEKAAVEVRALEAERDLLRSKAPLGVWGLQALDCLWSTYLLWTAIKEVAGRPRELAPPIKDALSAAANLAKSASGLLELMNVARSASKTLSHVGAGLTRGGCDPDHAASLRSFRCLAA